MLIKLALPIAFLAALISAIPLQASQDQAMRSQARGVEDEPSPLNRRIFVIGPYRPEAPTPAKPIVKVAKAVLSWLSKKTSKRDFSDEEADAFLASLLESRDLFATLFESREE